jgi:hypothetical protein
VEIENYFLDVAAGPYDIKESLVFTNSGSATVGFYIRGENEGGRGVSVKGLDPVAASSTRTTSTATGNNAVSDGDEVILSVPENSTALHLRGRLKIERPV